MWKEKEKDLGTVKVGQKQTLEFEYRGVLKVRNIVVSCGCLNANYIQATPDLGYCLVQFNPKPIPKHLVKMGKDFYNTNKLITLYTDKGTQEVSFKATVKSK